MRRQCDNGSRDHSDAAVSQEVKESWHLLESRRGRTNSFLKFPQETNHADNLILDFYFRLYTSRTQKKINLCGFKPLSLRFVIAAVGN